MLAILKVATSSLSLEVFLTYLHLYNELKRQPRNVVSRVLIPCTDALPETYMLSIRSGHPGKQPHGSAAYEAMCPQEIEAIYAREHRHKDFYLTFPF